ncbi:MAG: hypothetical protein MHM6MM_006891 [Cercozoa sp. M6MM]
MSAIAGHAVDTFLQHTRRVTARWARVNIEFTDSGAASASRFLAESELVYIEIKFRSS